MGRTKGLPDDFTLNWIFFNLTITSLVLEAEMDFFFFARSCASIGWKKVETLLSIIKDAIRVGPDRQEERRLSFNLPRLPVQGVVPGLCSAPLPLHSAVASITPQHETHKGKRNTKFRLEEKQARTMVILSSTIFFFSRKRRDN